MSDFRALLHATKLASPARVATAAVMALLASAACSNGGATPCAHCDGGRSDGPVDAVDAPVSEPSPSVDSSPSDTSTEGAAARPDSPPGEAPLPTPIPDAGYVLVEDFQTGKAPGWQSEEGDGTDASLAGWTVILGTSGTVFSQGILDESTWRIAYTNPAIGPDQIIEARLRVIDFYAETPSSAAAVFGRYDPSTDSGYFVALRGDGSAILRKRDHGSNASWGAGIDAGLRPGTWYTVRLEVIGNALTAFIDGVPVSSVTDDAPLGDGGIALGTVGATMEVDRISAGEP